MHFPSNSLILMEKLHNLYKSRIRVGWTWIIMAFTPVVFYFTTKRLITI